MLGIIHCFPVLIHVVKARLPRHVFPSQARCCQSPCHTGHLRPAPGTSGCG
uniref:Uncharacterized protein n=1 Tax=Anguilla anguilla TaxID=7936 RepID=A0A0E9WVZ7_ANGAN